MTSAIATAFARIALPFIVNDDDPETRAKDLGNAIAIALTELKHDEDLEPFDVVVGCLDHRIASFGLVVSDWRDGRRARGGGERVGGRSLGGIDCRGARGPRSGGTP